MIVILNIGCIEIIHQYPASLNQSSPQLGLMQVASPPFVYSLLHLGYAERQPGPTDAFLRSRILLSTILELPLRKALVAQLKGEDAQCVVDYLDRVRPEELLSEKFT